MMSTFDPRYLDAQKRLSQAVEPLKWREQNDINVTTDRAILADNMTIEELI